MDTLLTLTRLEMHCLQPLLRGGRRTIIVDILVKIEVEGDSDLADLIYSRVAALVPLNYESRQFTRYFSVLLLEGRVAKATVNLMS